MEKRTRAIEVRIHSGCTMEKFTRGAFVRCFLSSLISRSLPAKLTFMFVTDTGSTGYSTHFSFSFSFPSLSSFFLSVATICSPSRRCSWWIKKKKTRRIKLKKDWTKGWKWGQRVNKRETKIYGNLEAKHRLPKLIRFSTNKANFPPPPLSLCSYAVNA